jgi:hypothetical protein
MSARDLLRHVQALPEAERQQFLEGVEALRETQSAPKTMKAPDFTAYWTRLQSLGLPALDAAQTQAFDRWLAGEA